MAIAFQIDAWMGSASEARLTPSALPLKAVLSTAIAHLHPNAPLSLLRVRPARSPLMINASVVESADPSANVSPKWRMNLPASGITSASVDGASMANVPRLAVAQAAPKLKTVPLI